MRLGMSAVLHIAVAEFATAFSNRFEDYCNAPLSAVHPVRDDLSHVAVIFRHGARSLYSANPCFGNVTVSPECRLPNLASWGSGNAHSGVEDIQFKYPRCRYGSLLPRAQQQFKRVAETLQRSYPHLLDGLHTNDIYARSVDRERCFGSTFFLAGALVGEDGAETLDIESSNLDEDHWNLMGDAAAQTSFAAAFEGGLADMASDPEFPGFDKRWAAAVGKEYQPLSADCVLVAGCESLPMPKLLEDNVELQQQSLDWFLRATVPKVVTPTNNVVSAKMLGDIERSSHGKQRLSLFAASDLGILALLSALKAWDGLWTAYADVVTLEVYGENSDAVRLLRKGKPIHVPGCPGEICPSEIFFNLIESFAYERDEMLFDDAAEVERIEKREKRSANIRGILACCVLFLVMLAVGVLAGKRNARRDIPRRRRTAGTQEAAPPPRITPPAAAFSTTPYVVLPA